MRIRTIKPDFWTNERMSALSADARLLAIALLNYADDRGCFQASPAVIRGSLFPFSENSTEIKSSLLDLEQIDYIRLRKGPDGREYGIIVNFLSHQVINRPNESRIFTLCDFSTQCATKFSEHSVSYHGALSEDSLREGNGNRMEGNGNRSIVHSEQPNERKSNGSLKNQAEEIYQAYPRKIGKGAAIKAILKALDRVKFETLLEAVQAFSRSPAAKEGKFTPFPATWFNQERWNDDRKEWSRTYQQNSTGNQTAGYKSGGYADEIAAAIARNKQTVPVGSGSQPGIDFQVPI